MHIPTVIKMICATFLCSMLGAFNAFGMHGAAAAPTADKKMAQHGVQERIIGKDLLPDDMKRLDPDNKEFLPFELVAIRDKEGLKYARILRVFQSDSIPRLDLSSFIEILDHPLYKLEKPFQGQQQLQKNIVHRNNVFKLKITQRIIDLKSPISPEDRASMKPCSLSDVNVGEIVLTGRNPSHYYYCLVYDVLDNNCTRLSAWQEEGYLLRRFPPAQDQIYKLNDAGSAAAAGAGAGSAPSAEPTPE